METGTPIPEAEKSEYGIKDRLLDLAEDCEGCARYELTESKAIAYSKTAMALRKLAHGRYVKRLRQ